MKLNQATAGLRNLFHNFADIVVHEVTSKDKARFVAPLPDGSGDQLVAEGSSWRKGNWQVYLQTPIGGGKRELLDLFNASNDDVIGKMDDFIDGKTGGNNDAVDSSYIENLRIPLQQMLHKNLG